MSLSGRGQLSSARHRAGNAPRLGPRLTMTVRIQQAVLHRELSAAVIQASTPDTSVSVPHAPDSVDPHPTVAVKSASPPRVAPRQGTDRCQTSSRVTRWYAPKVTGRPISPSLNASRHTAEQPAQPPRPVSGGNPPTVHRFRGKRRSRPPDLPVQGSPPVGKKACRAQVWANAVISCSGSESPRLTTQVRTTSMPRPNNHAIASAWGHRRRGRRTGGATPIRPPRTPSRRTPRIRVLATIPDIAALHCLGAASRVPAGCPALPGPDGALRSRISSSMRGPPPARSR
jgi:hypothetical protein